MSSYCSNIICEKMTEKGGCKMGDKTELQKISEETMRFMRGKYVLDQSKEWQVRPIAPSYLGKKSECGW